MQLIAFAENAQPFTVKKQTDAMLITSDSTKGLLEMGS